jgi:hypothetical protein
MCSPGVAAQLAAPLSFLGTYYRIIIQYMMDMEVSSGLSPYALNRSQSQQAYGPHRTRPAQARQHHTSCGRPRPCG